MPYTIRTLLFDPAMFYSAGPPTLTGALSISTGLLDFPALVSGRQVWLCWRLGETGIGYWHAHDEGFAGRRPLANLPGGVAHG